MRFPTFAIAALALSACAPKVPHLSGPLRTVGTPRPTPPVAAVVPAAPPRSPRDEPSAPAIEAPADDPGEAVPRRRGDHLGVEIARAAEHYLRHAPRGYRDDCSGFASAALQRAGLSIEGSTAQLWELAKDARATHRRKEPDPGDIAFFDDTWDRNGDGRRNDDLTHVAVVIDVKRDGTILLAHAGTSAGRATLRMNLRHPSVHDDGGEILNDWLRRRSGDEPESSKYLSGELWRGFATFEASEAVADSAIDPPGRPSEAP